MKTVGLILMLGCAAKAAPPTLTALSPWGAQRGKAVTLTISGANLSEGAKIVSTLPGTFTPLAPEMGSKRLPFLVELKRDAPVGLYPIRVETANGISNVLLFSVGAFPEIREVETEGRNDSIATAMEVKSTPVLVNGTLRAAERDVYKVYGKAGEKRVFEVEARRAGSGIDPALRILDGKGKLLASVEDTPGMLVDCRLEFTFPAEGSYFVEIHDARYSEQTTNFYRLKMGQYACATAMFPLGWKRGEAIEVELSGGNLVSPVKAKPEGGLVRVPEGGLPMTFVQSDSAETLEPAGTGPHVLTLGTVVNGRIAKAGEMDRYKLTVEPGKTYIVEAEAKGLGTSLLDAVISVFEDGKRVQSAGDELPTQAVNAFIVAGDLSRDPWLLIRGTEKRREVIVAIDDLTQSGGPGYGYRLQVREQPPDFELTLQTPYVNVPSNGAAIVAVNVDRRGYAGPVQLRIANLPADLEVTGGTVPAEITDTDNRAVSRRGVLMVSAKPGAKARALNLEVIGEATLEGGMKMIRKAPGPGMIAAPKGTFGFVDSSRRAANKAFTAPWLGLELPAAVGYEAPGVLEVETPRRVKIVQGMRYDFPWKFTSGQMGIRAPETVATETPGARDLRLSDKNRERRQGSGMVTMNTTIGTPASTFDVILSARVGPPMQEEVVYAKAVTVEIVQGYTVEAPKQSGMELTGTVRREEGFTGAVTITPDALPLGVSCPPVEVAENGSEYRIRCTASAEAPAGKHTILLNPASILPEGEKGKVPYKIAPVEAVLTVTK